MSTLAELEALGADALREALSGPPATLASLLRAAAKGGVIEAQARLGQLLLDHPALADDGTEALRRFAAAATCGHVMAMNMVGRCTEHGWGTAPDTARAAQWYRAAAERGLDWGMYNLATLLTLGDGVTQDRAQALALFERAAALGHAKSINMVGSFHEDGWVLPPDRRRAAEHYARAAEAGDFRGQFNHARMLIEGGAIDRALPWLARIPDTATPRFLDQVRAWLAAQRDPRLRHLRLDA